jgi:hypothetical protein
MTATLEVDQLSLQQLAATLRELAPSVERKYVRSALERSATILMRDIRQRLKGRPWSKSERGVVNKKTGRPVVGLRKSVQRRPSSQWPSGPLLARRGIIGIAIGHKYPEGAHAHLVEHGHQLVKKTRRGTKVIGRVKGHPYLGPAWRASKATIEAMLKSAILDGIMRDAERLRAGKRVSKQVLALLEHFGMT